MLRTVQVFENNRWVRDEQILVPDPTSEESNEVALTMQLQNAMSNLRSYGGLASPTAAQTTSVVKLLCRVVIALVRLQLRQLDATD